MFTLKPDAEQRQQQAPQQLEVHRQARRLPQQPLVPQLQLQQQRLRQQHLVHQPQPQRQQRQLAIRPILVQNRQELIPIDVTQAMQGLIVVVKGRVVFMLHWAELFHFVLVICETAHRLHKCGMVKTMGRVGRVVLMKQLVDVRLIS